MPRGDGTGPMGQGPMTGRGAGFCAGHGVPGYMNMPGRGWYGRGWGGRAGRGYRHMYYATGVPGWARYGVPGYAPAPPTPENEMRTLKEQAGQLEEALDEIRRRLAELQNDESE